MERAFVRIELRFDDETGEPNYGMLHEAMEGLNLMRRVLSTGTQPTFNLQLPDGVYFGPLTMSVLDLRKEIIAAVEKVWKFGYDIMVVEAGHVAWSKLEVVRN